MILKELRLMRGPNMWRSENHKIIALNLTFEPIREKIDDVLKSMTSLTEIKTDASSDDTVEMKLTHSIAKVIEYLQPTHADYFHEVLKKAEDSYYIIYSYEKDSVGETAGEAACEIVTHVFQGTPFNLQAYKEQISNLHKRSQFGPSTNTIVEAALQKGIPLKKIPGGLLLLGQGKYQKRVSASIVETTSDIAVAAAGDKELTKRLLANAMIPVPKGYVLVKEDALEEIVNELSFPLVTKPLDGHQGQGITSDITQFDTLINGFREAKKYSREVIIEKHIKGNDYRFLVINYKLIAVAKRSPAMVTGDGRSTIEELVNKVNEDPKRGDGHRNILTKIILDENSINLLRSKNKTIQHVPALNEIVYLKDTANLSTGGTAEDVTDEVHPENVMLAERAARIIGLDICGIDIMAPDVTTPINKNGGAVLEVNAAPGLRMHIAPSGGKTRNVGDPIVDLLFPKGSNFKIPIVAITGTNGKTTTSRLMSHIIAHQGYNVGFTSTDGIYINNTCIYKGDCSGPKSADVVLYDPTVDFAVLECARGGIIRSGLAFDSCDIGIVTNVAADHLGLKDIYTVEDLASVKAVVPQSVSEKGYAVLNASVDLVYNMKDKVKSKVAFFSIDPENKRIADHCAQGGIAATFEEGNVVIINGDKRIIIESVENIPLTIKGMATFMIENVLSCVLSSYLLKFDLEKVRASLRSFKPSAEQTPGRLNMFEINGVNVLVDYAHNPHGLKALHQLLSKISTRKIGIVTGVGDRRDEDITEVGSTAAIMYDEVIIRIDTDTRGRKAEEIAQLVIKGIEKENKDRSHYVVPDSKEALLFGLSIAKKGDYVVISADDALKTIEIVKEIEKELV